MAWERIFLLEVTMTKKRMLIVMCVITLAASALAFGYQAQTNHSQQHQDSQANKTSAPQEKSEAVVAASVSGDNSPVRQSGVIPERVVYRTMFRHFVALKKKAEEKEKQGQDGAALRHFYKREAKLNDKQEKELDRIASKVDLDVEKKDKRAKEIINEYRSHYPQGQIPKGETLPPPPAELQQLQDERNALILSARDELRKAFGEEEFQRFDKFVRDNIASKMKPVRFDRPRPEMPNAPRKPERTNRVPEERTGRQ